MTGMCSWSRQGSGGPMRPSLPQKKWLFGSGGSGGGLWVSNGLMVWSIFDLGGGVVCLINLFVFQPRRHLCTSS